MGITTHNNVKEILIKWVMKLPTETKSEEKSDPSFTIKNTEKNDLRRSVAPKKWTG